MSELYIAFIGLMGSAVGAAAGVILNTKLIVYRIEQLEKKVDKHNNTIERTFTLEKKVSVLEERIDVANHRIEDLENGKSIAVVSDNKYYKEH